MTRSLQSGTPQTRRSLQAPSPEVHPLSLQDGADIRLTRYRGGDRGPVMLVHCIGVSSRMYSLDTIDTNLVEYLVAAGFDVWLLDFRFSIDLPASSLPASFDMVAELDYPAAVGTVLRNTGRDSLQVVAHGIGSQTFSMAMLLGLQGVRSAVCSQVAVHLHAPRLSRFKAALRMPTLLRRVGLDTLTTSPSNPGVADWLMDASLRLHPVEARCASRTCRRVTAFYGPLYQHDRLNPPTHDALPALFGHFNLRAFAHLGRNLNRGHLVREDGADVYRPQLDRLAIPVTFLHGLDNRCLLPESTRETFDALGERNGRSLYRWHGIAGYGHVDCMIGERAVSDVYPLILDHLENF